MTDASINESGPLMSANTNVALIVIYNHKYEKNIPIIEALYRSRFPVIWHLVPFYTGSQPNVIAVYESSYYFQGYVAQGFRHFRGDHKHYFFVADDMILNPCIDHKSCADVFALDDDTGFVPELDSMPADRWPHNRAAMTFDPFRPGVEVRDEIPSAAAARQALDALQIPVRNGAFGIRDTYFFDDDFRPKNLVRQLIRIAYDRFVLKARGATPRYPFVRSYSDIFIVPAARMDAFVRYCGAFAATDLWVELAIPTAMALSGMKIRVQSEMRLQGRPLWSAQDLEVLDPYDRKLSRLLRDFPSDYIYLHPIKLSRWDTTLDATDHDPVEHTASAS